MDGTTEVSREELAQAEQSALECLVVYWQLDMLLHVHLGKLLRSRKSKKRRDRSAENAFLTRAQETVKEAIGTLDRAKRVMPDHVLAAIVKGSAANGNLPGVSIGPLQYRTAHEAARETLHNRLDTIVELHDYGNAKDEIDLWQQIKVAVVREPSPPYLQNLKAQIQREAAYAVATEAKVDAEPQQAAGDDSDPIEDALIGQTLPLYRCLKTHRNFVNYDTLAEFNCDWRNLPPSDGTIKRALKNLQSALSNLAHAPQLKVEHAYRRAKLIKSAP